MPSLLVGKSGGGEGPLAGIGNAAAASKRDTGGGQTLKEFTVKQGDGGGVVVCETSYDTPPAGRRYGASFPNKGSYVETPFPDGAGAAEKVTALLGRMGVTATEGPAEEAAELPEAPPEAPPPPVAAARGPNLGVARVGPPARAPYTPSEY